MYTLFPLNNTLESCLSLEHSKAEGLAAVFVVWEATETYVTQNPPLSALSAVSEPVSALHHRHLTFITQRTNSHLHPTFTMFNKCIGPVAAAGTERSSI